MLATGLLLFGRELVARVWLNLALVEFHKNALAAGDQLEHVGCSQSLAQKAQDLAPSAAGYELLGHVYVWQGDLEQAAQAWRQSERSLSHFLQTTRTLQEAGYVQIAFEHYRALAVLSPQSSLPWYAMGQNLTRQRRYEQAMAAFQRAVELSNFAGAPIRLGDVYLAAGETLRRAGSVADAYQSFWAATEAGEFSSTERQAYALMKQGEMLVWMQRYQEAVVPLQASLQIDPTLYNAYSLLGVVAYHQGDAAQAEFFWRQAIDIEPDYVWPYLHLANMYAEMGDTQRAIYFYHQALDIEPGNPNALDGLRELEP